MVERLGRYISEVMSANSIGLFALSADPIHFGHVELIREAKSRVDKLIVLVSENDDKAGKYTFGLHARAEQTRSAIKDIDGIEGIEVITPPNNNKVLADIYVRNGCTVLFRGIRNEADRKYEEAQLQAHNLVYPMNVEFITLNDRSEYKNVSSSLVRAFAKHHLDISKFAPIAVKKELELRHGFAKFAITGRMATGKSHVTCMLGIASLVPREQPWRSPLPIEVINVDELICQVYSSEEEGCKKVTNLIANLCKSFGSEDLYTDEKFDTKKLAAFMFSNKCPREVKIQIESLVKPFVNVFYRDALNKIKGPLENPRHTIVLIEWAQLAEMNMGHWTNYNVIIVDSPDRERFAERRGLSSSALEERSRFQWSPDEKEKALREAAKGEGNIIRFENRMDMPFEEYKKLYETIRCSIYR